MRGVSMIDTLIETFMTIIFILFIVFVCAMILVSGLAFVVGWYYKWWITIIGFIGFVFFVALLRWIGEQNQWW